MSAASMAGVAGCFRSNAESSGTTGTAATGSAPADRCGDAAFDGDDPLAVEFDARRRFGCRGELLDGFEDLSVWETYAGRLDAAEGSAYAGSQSARLTAAPDDGRAWIYRKFDSPLDLSDRDLSLAVRLEAPESESVVVQLLAPDRENQIVLSKGVWRAGWMRVDLGPSAVRGDPDLSDVRELRIQLPVGEGDEGRLLVDAVRTTPKPDRGAVMLTFDDNHRTQYETAFPVMDRYGIPGTVGVIHRAVDYDATMSVDEMRELRDAGWDMASHPQLDRSFRQLSPGEGRTAFRESKRWLVDEGFEDGARFLVWPFGKYDADAVSAAARYHYLGFAGGGSPAGARVTEPLVVGRVTGDDPERTAAMIDLAERYNLLTVVRCHTVGVDDDKYVSTEGFERIVEHLDAADVNAVTPSDLWDG
ncbi:polysaccharide deacetylase family protein [Halostella sp. JP-L12]|uniref:polysaccharide deacetylase family protein n=2 Tax=Halostella TaxID=1843185 RepID=UPI00140B66AF|nr:polysaccharide deacetylase family protein [Halostella sp. JP-L12]NHN47077.1 polysaccharide deacetylase family protein [Halostella sp. JP-L12]